MARLPDLDPAKFTPEQKKVHDAVLAGPRGRVVGPIKVWLKNAGLAEHAQALGAYCRFNSSLPPRLSEVAILCTGHFWKAQYEWYVHARIAAENGVKEATIRDLKAGRPPKSAPRDELAIYAFVKELYATRRVSNATYTRVQKILGDAGTVELVGILGYYDLVSMALIAQNTTAAPSGDEPPLVPASR